MSLVGLYLSRSIWSWCISRSVDITAVHIPGIDNVNADALSRNFNDSVEWSLFIYLFIYLWIPQRLVYSINLSRGSPCMYLCTNTIGTEIR